MQVAIQGIVVQRRTRLPEAPVTIPIEGIQAVEPDTSSSTGRAVAIGAAAGAGAALGVLLLLAAIYAALTTGRPLEPERATFCVTVAPPATART